MFLTDIASTTSTLVETTSDANFIESVKEVNWTDVWTTILNWCGTTGIKLIIGLLAMIILFAITNKFAKKIYNRLKKKGADETISRVIRDITRIALKILIICGFVAFVGIETASVSAVITSIGVCISLAVQGTLSNVAGGVIIIFMRPFKLGDYITSGDYSGTVEDIKLFYTHLITPDNKMVYVPNGTLANNVIVNASAKETRRVEVKMSVAYNTDVELAKNLCLAVCSKNEKILKEPKPFAQVSEYADSAIIITCRCWCKNSEYWDTTYYLLDEIKKAFNENNIDIPFNQLDVTIKNKEESNK